MERISDKRLKKAKKLRRFGYSFSIGMAVLSAIGVWKHFPMSVISITAALCLFHALGALFKPVILQPTEWLMSSILKWIGNLLTAVIFTVLYYVLFTPIALILRFAGKDVIRANSISPSWKDVAETENDPKRIERLY